MPDFPQLELEARKRQILAVLKKQKKKKTWMQCSIFLSFTESKKKRFFDNKTY
jgi:hypothetical protein